MRDTVASCAAGYLDATPLLDLNYLEDCGGGPDIAVAWHPRLDKIVLLQADNRVGVEAFEEVTGLALAGCAAVAEFMRGELLQYVKRAVRRREMLVVGKEEGDGGDLMIE
jgi:exosome complex component RRP41